MLLCGVSSSLGCRSSYKRADCGLAHASWSTYFAPSCSSQIWPRHLLRSHAPSSFTFQINKPLRVQCRVRYLLVPLAQHAIAFIMTDSGNLALRYIPPPPLPEFYLPTQTSASSRSGSTSSESEHNAQNFLPKGPPVTGDGVYDGRPYTSSCPANGSNTMLPLIAIPPLPISAGANEVPPLAIYHICRICIRPRSARYHLEHPIPLNGLPPPPGICRRCRVKAVEDVSDLDLVVKSESNKIKLGCILPFVPEEAIVSSEEMKRIKIDKYLRENSIELEKPRDGSRSRRNIAYRHVRVIDDLPEDEGVSRHRTRVTFRSEDDAGDQGALQTSRNKYRVIRSSKVKGDLVDDRPQSTDTAVRQKAIHNVDSAKASVSTQAASMVSGPQARSVASASANVVQKPPPYRTDSEIRKLAREEIERQKAAFYKSGNPETEMRRIARDEIERYRRAERIMESYGQAYTYGKLVPVERHIDQERDAAPMRAWEQYPAQEAKPTVDVPRATEACSLDKRSQSPEIRQTERKHIRIQSPSRGRSQRSSAACGTVKRNDSKSEASTAVRTSSGRPRWRRELFAERRRPEEITSFPDPVRRDDTLASGRPRPEARWRSNHVYFDVDLQDTEKARRTSSTSHSSSNYRPKVVDVVRCKSPTRSKPDERLADVEEVSRTTEARLNTTRPIRRPSERKAQTTTESPKEIRAETTVKVGQEPAEGAVRFSRASKPRDSPRHSAVTTTGDSPARAEEERTVRVNADIVEKRTLSPSSAKQAEGTLRTTSEKKRRSVKAPDSEYFYKERIVQPVDAPRGLRLPGGRLPSRVEIEEYGELVRQPSEQLASSPPRQDTHEQRRQRRGHIPRQALRESDESNHVHFSNKIDYTPTPPDSEASSSAFRSYHSFGRGSSRQIDGNQSSNGEMDVSEPRGRMEVRRGRLSSNALDRPSPVRHRDATVRPSRDEDGRSGRNTGRPIDRALSESPSREKSIAALTTRNPQNAPSVREPSTSRSARVEDEIHDSPLGTWRHDVDPGNAHDNTW